LNSGAINSAGDYKLTLATTAGVSVRPGEWGRFSLKIWHTDPATKTDVVDDDSQGVRPGVAARSIVLGRILQK